MLRTKYLSAVLLLFSGHAVIAQVEVRDPMQPTIAREPLTDANEATRLFYLTLANMPSAHLVVGLRKMGLSNSEITTVAAAMKNLRTAHDANASAYAAQAMRRQNNDEDQAAYIGQDNDLLQQAE